MTLALDAKDWDAADGWHAQLVKMQPSSLFVRGELARELFTRGEYERAEGEFVELVTASQGDNRALAPALKDLGKTLAKEHKNDQALATLKRALAVAGAEAGVRGEVYEAITGDLPRRSAPPRVGERARSGAPGRLRRASRSSDRSTRRRATRRRRSRPTAAPSP